MILEGFSSRGGTTTKGGRGPTLEIIWVDIAHPEFPSLEIVWMKTAHPGYWAKTVQYYDIKQFSFYMYI